MDMPPPTPVRRGPLRDRRGRGRRGPIALPGPLSPDGVPVQLSPRERFDDLVLSLVQRLVQAWPSELGEVVFGVEETPTLPEGWTDDVVPLGTVVRPTPSESARIVVFRLPVQRRARGRTDTAGLVWDVLVEQVADLLGRDPEDIDPAP
ncbi:MAG: metallopeptidase family protein [Nocardioidaceae bacterium]